MLGGTEIVEKYYIVDRFTSLACGNVISKDKDYSTCHFFPIQGHFKQAELENLVEELFTDGLTNHGKRYFLDECLVIKTDQGPAKAVPNTPAVELIVELVRRLEFPEALSRFEAVFAWKSIGEAQDFRNDYGQGKILLVEGEAAGKYDMNQLYLGGTTVGSWLFARRYWSGVSGPTPRWEILLKPPVKVLEECDS